MSYRNFSKEFPVYEAGLEGKPLPAEYFQQIEQLLQSTGSLSLIEIDSSHYEVANPKNSEPSMD